MRGYNKIETLFDRDPATFRVKVGAFRRPEFAAIDRWFVTEKIDGTNIRIDYRRVDDRISVSIGGRTDNAQIPTKLLTALNLTAADAGPEVEKIFEEFNIDSYTLYGEGYGASIQKGGGNYRQDQGFILFDVLVNDRTWLGPRDMIAAGSRLGLKTVPVLGDNWATDSIVNLVQSGYESIVAEQVLQAEGVVAVPQVPLYDGRGNRVQFKLKTRDFLGGKH